MQEWFGAASRNAGRTDEASPPKADREGSERSVAVAIAVLAVLVVLMLATASGATGLFHP